MKNSKELLIMLGLMILWFGRGLVYEMHDGKISLDIRVLGIDMSR